LIVSENARIDIGPRIFFLARRSEAASSFTALVWITRLTANQLLQNFNVGLR
jgi:hypothetical protein